MYVTQSTVPQLERNNEIKRKKKYKAEWERIQTAFVGALKRIRLNVTTTLIQCAHRGEHYYIEICEFNVSIHVADVCVRARFDTYVLSEPD